MNGRLSEMMRRHGALPSQQKACADTSVVDETISRRAYVLYGTKLSASQMRRVRSDLNVMPLDVAIRFALDL